MAKELSDVKTMSIEIVGFGIDSGQRNKWVDISRDCQEIMNLMVEEFMVWHRIHNTKKEIKRSFETYKAWKDSGEIGPKPPYPEVLRVAIPKELKERITKRIYEEYPDVHTRTVNLLMKRWESYITHKNGTNCNVKLWLAWILNREGYNFTRPVPIPFDKQQATLYKDEKGISLPSCKN